MYNDNVILYQIKDSRVTSGTKRVGEGPGEFHSNGDDEMIDDDEIAEEIKYLKLCAAGDCSSMPAKQKMKIKVSSQKTVETKINSFIVIFSDIYRFTMTAPSTLIPVMSIPIWTRW